MGVFSACQTQRFTEDRANRIQDAPARLDVERPAIGYTVLVYYKVMKQIKFFRPGYQNELLHLQKRITVRI
jgi:hypothetical protein